MSRIERVKLTVNGETFECNAVDFRVDCMVCGKKTDHPHLACNYKIATILGSTFVFTNRPICIDCLISELQKQAHGLKQEK